MNEEEDVCVRRLCSQRGVYNNNKKTKNTQKKQLLNFTGFVFGQVQNCQVSLVESLTSSRQTDEK